MKKKDFRDSKGEELADGDLVKLKSGGAEMIINDIYYCNNDNAWKATCVWQDQLQMQQVANYVLSGLIKIPVTS